MLVHQAWESEGAVTGVNIVSTTIISFSTSGTVYSGVRFGSDGVLYRFQPNGGVSALPLQWLLSGTASDYYVSRTVGSGTLDVDAGAGPLQLNANRDYNIQNSMIGIETAEVFFEIASDVSGSPVVGEGTITFQAEKESGS